MYATRDIVHSIVAVEWVVLVNCTDVGCTGLLGPEIKVQTMADNYAANVHSCLPFTITLAVADDGYDNTVTSHV